MPASGTPPSRPSSTPRGALNDDVGLWAGIDRPRASTRTTSSIRSGSTAISSIRRSPRSAHASQTQPLVALVGVDTFRDWWRTESFVDVRTHRRLADTELIGVTSA